MKFCDGAETNSGELALLSNYFNSVCASCKLCADELNIFDIKILATKLVLENYFGASRGTTGTGNKVELQRTAT